MTATITLTSPDQAQFIADMPQLAGNGHQVDVNGSTVTLTDDALEVLADLPEDNDGHFDGTAVYIGGTAYTAS